MRDPVEVNALLRSSNVHQVIDVRDEIDSGAPVDKHLIVVDNFLKDEAAQYSIIVFNKAV